MIIKLIQLKMNKRPMDTELKIRMSPSLGLLTIANLLKVDVLPSAIEIAKIYRAKNIPVVVGGIHITAVPKAYLDYFDVISIGMAETTWPDIIKDLENKRLKKYIIAILNFNSY